VGSILVRIDPELKTNCKATDEKGGGICSDRIWTPSQTVDKGAYFGEFNLGSTVVLIFEGPHEFKVKPGDVVRVGERL
jgi:phosphatidylserine decarboxylase